MIIVTDEDILNAQEFVLALEQTSEIQDYAGTLFARQPALFTFALAITDQIDDDEDRDNFFVTAAIIFEAFQMAINDEILQVPADFVDQREDAMEMAFKMLEQRSLTPRGEGAPPIDNTELLFRQYSLVDYIHQIYNDLIDEKAEAGILYEHIAYEQITYLIMYTSVIDVWINGEVIKDD